MYSSILSRTEGDLRLAERRVFGFLGGVGIGEMTWRLEERMCWNSEMEGRVSALALVISGNG
jgi:hypothetical protein